MPNTEFDEKIFDEICSPFIKKEMVKFRSAKDERRRGRRLNTFLSALDFQMRCYVLNAEKTFPSPSSMMSTERKRKI
jgi:hypothetical protein